MHQNGIRIFQTARNTRDRLTEKRMKFFSSDTGTERNIINVYDDVSYQRIIGFGGAFTESAADTFYRLKPNLRHELLNAYFGPSGHRYSICRTHMNSCDFSLSSYSCNDFLYDAELTRFNIERDLKAVIPFIREAASIHPFKLFFSPWSPPGWMKNNGRMSKGGILLNRYQKTWAEFFVRFIKAYQAQGIDFWGLTVQNEPKAAQKWESCIFSAKEEAQFLEQCLLPALASNNLSDKRIIIWDHNKERLYERVQYAFSKQEIADQIFGAAFHWYAGDHFEALDAVHDRFPDKYLIHSECCIEGAPEIGDWASGELYGHEIIGDLNHHTSAWCDWNLLLNKNGGPNHAGNYCDAPILADIENSRLIYEPSYWYIGHFSRFIIDGSVRICCTKFTDNLECAAFRTISDQIVLVVMNRSEDVIFFNLTRGAN